MFINIGTKNLVKIDALKEIISDYDFLKSASVRSLNVDSLVSEQPLSLEETIKGAKNRAIHAFSNCAYSFGLESGIRKVFSTKSSYMDVTVCAIYDGSDYHLGLSSSFEYPKKVIDLVLQHGLDISQAFKKLNYTSKDNLGACEGVIGILTKGRLNRKDYTKQAIMTALIHLENKEKYS